MQSSFDKDSPTTIITIQGMTCASCVGRVESALKAVPGVALASVNLATKLATVIGSASSESLESAIAKTGYQAQVLKSGHQNQDQVQKQDELEEATLKQNLSIALALSLPVFVMEMGSHIFPPLHHFIEASIGTAANWYLQFTLTSLVLLFPGRIFYQKGLPALLRFAPDMNSLVFLGTLAAYGFSIVATFMPSLLPQGAVHVYYESAVVIVTLILVGRFLEAKAKGRTSQAIKRLIGLQPKTARVRRQNETVELPLEAILANDIVEVRPGERIALDGTVIEGESYVDESMVTGEPIAVKKYPDELVVGGTLNQKGAFSFRVSAVGSDTVLARIIDMVQQAQGSKLPIQAIVDRVTMWFVPAVMAVSLITFISWLAAGSLSLGLINAVAVLIIACPCAMGLAVPVSIMVGTGRAAEMGVLFRRGDALQKLKDVSIIAFDKTGTLTEGKPTLTDLKLNNGFERAQVLFLAASVEAKSEHPIASAIVQAAEAEGIEIAEVTSFTSITGFGVEAEVKGQKVEIGADRYMTKIGCDPAFFATEAKLLGDEGKSPIYIAIDGRLAAILAVSDPVKESTPEALNALHKLGLRLVMITGDNAKTAQAIATKLGIDEVRAEVLPEGKVEAVKALRGKADEKVAFVGDGINDAPALAVSDVGIAIGSGTDIAIEAAEVVLMSGHLQGVPKALELSQAVIKNIRQNLFWAFAYNAALIPLAAGVLYPSFRVLMSPIAAAAAMALSSLFVVTNALRLNRWQPKAGLR